MKRLQTYLALFSFAVSTGSAAPHIKVGELKLLQAFAPLNSKEEFREYLPEGESLSRWNRLASVRIFKDLKKPETYLQNVAAAVGKSHPLARFQVFRDPKTEELVLDFMTFSPDSAAERFAEWNLMRAKFVKGKGLVVYQYAMRIYDLEVGAAAKINAERNKMLGPFSIATFEEEKEPNLN